MPANVLFRSTQVTIADYVCTVGPTDGPPATEVHTAFSLAYVRKGTFGYHPDGRSFELVAGSVMVGRPGREYVATHEHAYGDECLSFKFSPELVDGLRGAERAWRIGGVAPLPALVVLAELVHGSLGGGSDVGADEVALVLAQRFVQLVTGQALRADGLSALDRRRAIQAARWLEEHSREDVGLADAAREVGLSVFHFLRLFSSVLGLTPHQHLVRTRLRRAAQILAQDSSTPITDVAYKVGFGDLSNFVRTFGRAAGISPGQFRRAAKGDRKIFQARMESLRPP